MAGASLLTLLDDIAGVLDDVAAMTKMAAKKTSGVLGDDLALNAEQASGVRADRELPVVWAVAKGSVRNKLILVPLALVLSAVAPWAVISLLLLGGAYLCYEGFEKLAAYFWHENIPHHAQVETGSTFTSMTAQEIRSHEEEKIQGAIRTDFVLSAEIIIITLGTVADAALATQITVLSLIALVMTIGVYGLVALIVKLDDMGLYLQQSRATGWWRQLQHVSGAGLLVFAPWLMKMLTVVGTLAMFTVGGGIFTHNLHFLHALSMSIEFSHSLPAAKILQLLSPVLFDAFVGILAGGLILGMVNLLSAAVARIRK